VNVAQVVEKINERTSHLQGLKVPVTVTVDTKTKQFEVEVGLPPVSVMVKKELELEKGSKTAGKETVGDLPFEKVVEIAKGRLSAMLARDLKKAVKEVLGTCLSMGVTVNGKDPREVQREVEEGKREVA